MNMALQRLEGYRPDKIIKRKNTFKTASGFLRALLQLSQNQFNQSPDAQLDQLRGRSLLYAHQQFHHLIGKNWLAYDKGPFVLVHGDFTLQDNNVLVDEDFNVTAVIDWQWSFVMPLQCLVPPVWLTGSHFDFMLDGVDWYTEEFRRLLEHIKKLERSLGITAKLSTVWECITPTTEVAVVTALLHPNYIYHTFWDVLYWQLQGVDVDAEDFDEFQYSRDHTIPLLEAFMKSEISRSLLIRKVKEQEKFWLLEAQYFGQAKKTAKDDYTEVLRTPLSSKGNHWTRARCWFMCRRVGNRVT